jgi:hypothetical protein
LGRAIQKMRLKELLRLAVKKKNFSCRENKSGDLVQPEQRFFHLRFRENWPFLIFCISRQELALDTIYVIL